MCGIIHAKRADITQHANKLIARRYENQKTRGQEGYGFIELKNGFVVAEVRTQGEKEIMEKLYKSTADEIMFHHRYPTSTPNIIESTHPIKVSNPKLKYNYYVSHNGIISNDEELRTKHIREGYAYTTDVTKKWITPITIYSETLWNDSEALAIDFAQAIETGKELEAKGSIAIIALQYEKDTGKAIALYFGRNGGNPLCVEQDKKFFALSSETGQNLVPDTLYRMDYQTGEITQTSKDIGIWSMQISGFGWDTRGYGYNPNYEAEEDDFDVDMHEEVCALEDAIERANQTQDYDLAQELTCELEELKIEINSIKKRGRKGEWI